MDTKPDRSALRPEIRAFLEELEAEGPGGFAGLNPVDVRPDVEAGCRDLWGPDLAEPGSIRDIEVPGSDGPIPARVYSPERPKDLPGMVFFHGGGWVIGSIDTHDGPCRLLAEQLGCVLISVQYRKAPEYPFPAPIDDAWAATRWVASHAESLGIDPNRLSVVGESSGGNLAAVVARKARDHGLKLASQVLVYPVTDSVTQSPSYDENSVGFYLTKSDMEWFTALYATSEDDLPHPDFSPLRASDLSGLTPAYVVTVKADPLHDEGVAYAERLASAGVPVVHTDYPDIVHGTFIMQAITPATGEMIGAIADYLSESWSPTSPS